MVRLWPLPGGSGHEGPNVPDLFRAPSGEPALDHPVPQEMATLAGDLEIRVTGTVRSADDVAAEGVSWMLPVTG